MNGSGLFFIFRLDGRDYALYLSSVLRVLPMIEITALPKAPGIVIGIVNIGGEIIPVFDVRKRFSLPPRERRLGDRLILAQTSRRKVGLVVDETQGLTGETEACATEGFAEAAEYVAGVLKLDGGIVLIHDLDTFLSAGEEQKLDAALREKDAEKGE